MESMTTQERYEDISKICGFSEDIVRAVLNAEKQSIVKSLKRGERATLMGRCVIRPELRSRIVVGGGRQSYIKLGVNIAPSLVNEFSNITTFEEKDDSPPTIPEGIRMMQIPALG